MNYLENDKNFEFVSKNYFNKIISIFIENGMEIPQNEDIEIFIVSNFLYHFREFSLYIPDLSPNFFQNEKHKILFTCLLKFYKDKQELDNINFFIDYFKRDSIIEINFQTQEEFVNYLKDLKIVSGDISSDLKKQSVEDILIYNIENLKNYYVRKEVIFTSIKNTLNVVYNLQNLNIDLDNIIENVTKGNNKVFDIFDIIQSKNKNAFLPSQEVVIDLCDYYTDVMALKEGNNAMIGLPSGFRDLDNITKGFRKGDLVIIAGRPSMGKTAFALNIASNIAYEKDKNVAIFSIEMSAMQLMQRFLVSKLTPTLNSVNLKNINFDNNDLKVLSDLKEKAVNNELNFNVYINEMGNLNPFQIERKLSELSNKLKDKYQQIDLVIIDYLQLMSSNSINSINRNAEISDITRRLKLIAKNFQVPIILLSQLSREVERRADKRPIMADLRDSGSIEQDADLILMLYRPDYYKKLALIENDNNDNNENKENKENQQENTQKNENNDEDIVENSNSLTEIIISKHRNGETGIINLNFNKNKMLFENIDNPDNLNI